MEHEQSYILSTFSPICDCFAQSVVILHILTFILDLLMIHILNCDIQDWLQLNQECDNYHPDLKHHHKFCDFGGETLQLKIDKSLLKRDNRYQWLHTLMLVTKNRQTNHPDDDTQMLVTKNRQRLLMTIHKCLLLKIDKDHLDDDTQMLVTKNRQRIILMTSHKCLLLKIDKDHPNDITQMLVTKNRQRPSQWWQTDEFC